MDYLVTIMPVKYKIHLKSTFQQIALILHLHFLDVKSQFLQGASLLLSVFFLPMRERELSHLHYCTNRGPENTYNLGTTYLLAGVYDK